jgi:hypothetical protein
MAALVPIRIDPSGVMSGIRCLTTMCVILDPRVLDASTWGLR